MLSSGVNPLLSMSSMRPNEFYEHVESTFGFEVKELLRLQGFRSASSVLHSTAHVLDFLGIDSNDPNLLSLKQMIAFHQNDGSWRMKAGVRYDVDRFLSVLNQEELDRSADSVIIPGDVLRRYPWLKSLVTYCQSDLSPNDQEGSRFILSFIGNISSNLVTSPSRYRYSEDLEQFAFALFFLAGRQGYEFIRLNLPGSLPSYSTLSSNFNQNREKIREGQFRFDSMQTYLTTANVRYVFASEDCTGVVQKVSYDRDSNSFIGLCPPLQKDGFPRVSAFNISSFTELEDALQTQKISSLVNAHMIQPITPAHQSLSPFLLSAYGTDNKFDSYDLIERWLKMFDETSKRGIRIVGFSTDCDPRYLRAMRLVTNFFASLPNFTFRNRVDSFRVDLPMEKWSWFFLDPIQLFVVFQVKEDDREAAI